MKHGSIARSQQKIFLYSFHTKIFYDTQARLLRLFFFLFKTSKILKAGCFCATKQSNEIYEIYILRPKAWRLALSPFKGRSRISSIIYKLQLMATVEPVTEILCHLYSVSNTIATILWTSQLWCSPFSYATIVHSQPRPIFHHFLIPTAYPSPFEIFESTDS